MSKTTLLYDFGDYDPELVTFEIEETVLPLLKKVLGSPVKPRKLNIVKHLKSLLTKTHGADYHAKYWEKARKSRLKLAEELKGLSYTAGSMFHVDYMTKEQYVTYSLQEDKSKAKKNKQIFKVLEMLNV